ncbi:MAG: hypothetical protein JO307_06965 [Bryobacterales bacterium]|nr:hypothetical protein [Bryobacterales bacterium]
MLAETRFERHDFRRLLSHNCRRFLSNVLGMVAFSLVPLLAQGTSPFNWAAVGTANAPSPRSGHRIVYDSARSKIILFGGQDAQGNYLNDIWEWDTGAQMWTNVTPTTGSLPSPRSYFGMAYDPVRAKVVIYGGGANNSINSIGDTWEWDAAGKAWTQSAAASPIYAGLRGGSLAWDPNTQQIILFGGIPYWQTLNGNTYSYSSTAGWNLLTNSGPAPRMAQAMATDPVRSRVVMFGGVTDNGAVQDTWEWNGSSWTQVSSGGIAPAARADAAMAYDNGTGAMLLFGGDASSAIVQDTATWEWNGSAWTALTTQTSPSARFTAMAYDNMHNAIVLFGGSTANGAANDTYVGGPPFNWTGLSPAMAPSPRAGHRMVYDSARSKVILFGGQDTQGNYLNDIWEWDTAAQTWTNVTPTTGPLPSPRSYFGMAYDPVRAKVVIYGGGANDSVNSVGDTWEWDPAAKTWTQTAGSPIYAGLREASLAWDPNTQQIIMFGGIPYWQTLNGSTYSYSSTAGWNLLTNSGPAPRMSQAMSTDPVRSKVVMFGGVGDNGSVQDTWEWNGSSWTQVSSGGAGPAARAEGAMAYDNGTGSTLLFGGNTDGPIVQDTATWEWNGTTWTALTTQTSPSARFTAIAYDNTHNAMVLFGGSTVGGVAGDTYVGGPFAPITPKTVVTLTASPNRGCKTFCVSVVLVQNKENNVWRQPSAKKRSNRSGWTSC